MSIKLKFILSTTLIMFVLFFGLVFASLDFLRKSESHEIISHAKMTNLLLANSFKQSIISADLARLNDDITDLTDKSDISFIRIIDDNNKVLAQTGNPELLARDFMAHSNKDIFNGSKVFNIATNIEVSGYKLGHIETGYSLKQIHEEFSSMQYSVLSIAIVSLVASLLLAVLIAELLTRRILLLDKAATSIADGKLDFEINISGHDEVANTLRTFDSMVRNLKLLRDREKDNYRLITTVQNSQDIYIQNKHEENVFGELLKNILFITECEYGFIGLVEKNKQGDPCLNIRAVDDIAQNSDMADITELMSHNALILDNLDTSFGKVILHHKPVISNDVKKDMRSGCMPKGHPNLHNMLCVPVVSHKELIAVIGVANRNSDFTTDLVESLTILWQSTSHILQAYIDDKQKVYFSETLAEREAYLTTLFDCILDAIITTDEKGVIVDCNPPTLTITGYSRDELIGKNVAKLMPTALAKTHHSYMKGFVDNPSKLSNVILHNREVELQTKDGQRIPIEIGLSELHGVNSPAHFIGIIRDISEQKKYITAIEDARDKANEATRAKSDFLAVMSHEIRTPMHGILGMLQLIELGKLKIDERDKITSAYSSAKNLLHLLDNILDFSKVESGKLVLDSSEFNLHDLIDETISVFTQSIIGKNISLECILPPDLPEWFMSDPTRIRQILMNLIGNAIKFTFDGEIKLGLDIIESTNKQTRIKFSISDTGIGIEPDVIEKIFAPFSQADNSTTRNFGGTGLGLSISMTLIKLLGGELKVDSTIGKGSCFYFELALDNLESGNASPEIESESDNKQSGCTEELLDAHILLVEDNVVNQLVAIGIIEKSGCTVDVADNGQIAVAKFKDSRYDLILMDYQMPVMDGLQATHAIRAYEKDNILEPTPIVALTANTVKSDLERYLHEGMNDYLTKPFSVEEMFAKLQKWICCRQEKTTECNTSPAITNLNNSEVAMTVEHVNVDKLKELESLLGSSYNHLLETFFSNSAKTLSRLHELCETRNDNVEEIASLAHSLKGTTGNIGAISMHKYAMQLDKLAKNNDLDVMPELLDEIDDAFNGFKFVVEKKVS